MTARDRAILLILFVAVSAVIVWLLGREDGSRMVAGLFVMLVFAMGARDR